jgi:hypothetical protein
MTSSIWREFLLFLPTAGRLLKILLRADLSITNSSILFAPSESRNLGRPGSLRSLAVPNLAPPNPPGTRTVFGAWRQSRSTFRASANLSSPHCPAPCRRLWCADAQEYCGAPNRDGSAPTGDCHCSRCNSDNCCRSERHRSLCQLLI